MPLFTLCVCLAHMVSKLPVFLLNSFLLRRSVITYANMIYKRSVILRFLVISGGGGMC